MPQRRGGTWIVGREKQRQHKDKSGSASRANKDAQNQCEADGEFAVGHQERDRRRTVQYKSAENRFHERIGAAFAEEFIDPELKAAVQRELRSEDFVLRKDKEKKSDADTQGG